MDASATNGCATCSSITVTLEESDIEGAVLEEPLQTKTVPQLQWWLMCHGQDAPRSVKKKEVFHQLDPLTETTQFHEIHDRGNKSM